MNLLRFLARTVVVLVAVLVAAFLVPVAYWLGTLLALALALVAQGG